MKMALTFVFLFSVSAFSLEVSLDELRIASRQTGTEHILKNSLSLEAWIEQVNKEDYEFLCLSESHTDKYRNFYADLLPMIQFDHLMLEATATEAKELIDKSLNTTDDVKHEAALISNVLRNVFLALPKLQVTGVEQTSKQSLAEFKEELAVGRENKTISRESFIALNVLRAAKRGEKHIALYGSSHCSSYDRSLAYTKPFYRLIKDTNKLKVKSVFTIFASDNLDATKEFRKSLIGFGLADKSFVIPDTGKFSMDLLNHRNALDELFKRYDTIIYVNDK